MTHSPKRRRWPWLSLLLTLLFFALAVVALVVIAPIDTQHVDSGSLTPGQVSLPATAPASTVTGTLSGARPTASPSH